jgi:hypothetical protein
MYNIYLCIYIFLTMNNFIVDRGYIAPELHEGKECEDLIYSFILSKLVFQSNRTSMLLDVHCTI